MEHAWYHQTASAAPTLELVDMQCLDEADLELEDELQQWDVLASDTIVTLPAPMNR